MTSTSSTGGSSLLVQHRGPVCWLTLNRPRALNALDEELLRNLDTTLSALASGEQVGAVVLTGAGRRAFCFGADLKAIDGSDADARQARFQALLPLFQGVIHRLAVFPAPVLAAIGGFATGAGLDLALACDLRIATTRTKLGSAFVGLGLVPDGGGTYHLPRLVGLGRALELVLLAEAIDAETALAYGLLNRVVEPDQLETTATELAERLAAAPRPALLEARRLLRASSTCTLDGALAAERKAQLECAGSNAFEEALASRRR